MNLRPDEMAGIIEGPPIVIDAMRIYYADALVPGAFWYFTRQPYPARFPDSAFRARSFIPPIPKVKT